MSKRKTSVLDDLGKFFVAVPWWVGPIVVVVVYGLFQYALLPIMQSILPADGNPNTAVINRTIVQVLGPVLTKIAPLAAALVLIVWLLSLSQKWSRRKLLDKTRGVDAIRALQWRDFERLVGEYYRRRGFNVQERGGASPDGGVDIVLGKGGKRTLVQCKHWKAFKVGVRPVRELLGVMSHERADDAILVTSGQYTAEAIDFAGKNRIELVDGDALNGMIRSVQGFERIPAATSMPSSHDPGHASLQAVCAPACPACGGPMVVRTARSGRNAGSQFYGCKQYPACRGIRNIVNQQA